MHISNTGKIAHGGFLSTIADTGMGTAAHRVAGDKRCVTINIKVIQCLIHDNMELIKQCVS